MTSHNNKALIFAAGLGTRLRPITNTRPKALAQVNGVPLLEITIKRLMAFGFNNLVINVHHFSGQIIDFLRQNNNFGANISLSDESDLLLDTGGGLKKAAHFFDDNKPFLVHNADILTGIDLSNLYNFHLNKPNVLATLAVNTRPASREFLIDQTKCIAAWRNNKTKEIKTARENVGFLEPVSFCGVHVINPLIFEHITETGVFSVIDVYLRLATHYNIATYNIGNSFWMDLGTPENLQKACECNCKFANKQI